MESGVFMKMVQITELKKTLESFLKLFDEYKEEIISERPQRNRLDELRKELQIKEPQITRHILNILGNGSIVIRSYGSQATIPYADLLATALMGGNNELRHNFGDFHAPVTSTLNRAIGKIEAGLWSPKEVSELATVLPSSQRTETVMRELKHLRYLTTRLISQVIIGIGDTNPKIGQYRRIFIRLMDKALREYKLARTAFISDITDLGRPFKFADHMETCLNCLSRLYKLLSRIKSEQDALSLPRTLRKQLEKSDAPIGDLRDSVEHMDEKIKYDEIENGEAVMIALNEKGDGFSIAKNEISFDNLATILEKMHETAVHILNNT